MSSRLTTDAERYLQKVHKSLASAKADARARRYNSAANRAYYTAFHAAVAALIQEGIRPAPKKGGKSLDWEHKFVSNQFSGKLIRRRKIYPSDLKSVLNNLSTFG